jgi:hypothetical protein
MVSHKHKFIFIHIPKTGGTSVQKTLMNNANIKRADFTKHEHLHRDLLSKTTFGHEALPHKLKSYFSFCFVRNPWEKIVSQYHFNRHWFGMQNYKFDEYVFAFKRGRRVSAKNPYFLPWITDEKGNVIVDFIGRYENIQEDFNTICDKIGIPQQQLPHKNKTKHKHYTEYYEDETRQIVAQKYAKDIDYFGYEFGE